MQSTIRRSRLVMFNPMAVTVTMAALFIVAAVAFAAYTLFFAYENWTDSQKIPKDGNDVEVGTRIGNTKLFEKWNLFYAFSSALVLWIAIGVVSAAHSLWMPVPLFGYCRIDLAITIVTALELPIAYLTAKLSHLRRHQYLGVMFLLFGLPALPDFIRPVINQQRHLLPYSSYGKVATHEKIGFTRNEALELTSIIWKYSDMWTHISDAQGLAYFNFGSSINFDRYGYSTAQSPGYSFKFGRELTAGRRKHESDFRLKYSEDWKHVQLTIQEQIAPTLRPILAKSLDVDTDDVVFGNEIENSILGQPGIGILLPNLLWHWIVNPHFDSTYANRIPRKITCAKADEVTTFIIPIATPTGAGLRYWTKDRDGSVVRNEVFYKVGNVYTFPATRTLHTIRPFPYREWRRGSARINVQAFGVQCDDGKWYIYH